MVTFDACFFVFDRYRNIWPFEHARVRLQKQRRSTGKPPTPPSYNSNPGTLHPLTLPQPADFLPPVTLSLSSSRSIQLPLHTPAIPSSTDDYVNASYVQPLGTKKRYIATQGPLPETFNDFWSCVPSFFFFFEYAPECFSFAIGLYGNKTCT